jgi:hypothetical protein
MTQSPKIVFSSPDMKLILPFLGGPFYLLETLKIHQSSTFFYQIPISLEREKYPYLEFIHHLIIFLKGIF